MDWPQTIGVKRQLVNLGEVRNRGFELSANWSDKINKNLSYFVSGNFSYLKNWVSDIGVKDADGNSGVWTSDKTFRNLPYMIQSAEGKPVNSSKATRRLPTIKMQKESAFSPKPKPVT